MSTIKKIFTVTEINNHTKELLKNDLLFSRNISIEGEIGDISSTNGNFYFTLKDDKSQIRVSFFNEYAKQCSFALKIGIKVVCFGSVELFNNKGMYTFKALSVTESGDGEIFKDYLKLKSKLEKEGLFDLSIKKKIPEFPLKIGVVTSETGAVIRDIITTVKNRAPWVSIILAPAMVQGPSAPASLISALELLESYGGIDTVIIGRGGGSFEDLNCFNDEELVRKVHSFSLPIIAAVGHETDTTLIELASDLRTATPTAAASAATPNYLEISTNLNAKNKLCDDFMGAIIRSYHKDLNPMIHTIKALRPSARVESIKHMLEGLSERLDRTFSTILNGTNNALDRIEGIINERDPYKPLKRGYAFVTDSSDHIIKSISGLSKGETISMRLSDGTVRVTVIDFEQK